MGLFDKFRKKVQEAAEEANLNELSAEENSEEADAALAMRESNEQPSLQQEDQIVEDDDWEEFDENEELELPSEEDDWDDWDDEDVPATLPVKLSRREKKILAREEKKKASKEESQGKGNEEKGRQRSWTPRRLESRFTHDANNYWKAIESRSNPHQQMAAPESKRKME